MKKLLIALCLIFVAGCGSVRTDTMHPFARADTVQIDLQMGHLLWIGENRDRAFIGKLITFDSSLPDEWVRAPRTPSAFFNLVLFFRRGEEIVGTISVGSDYFSHDYHDDRNVWQSVSKAKVDQLSAILGFDVWAFIQQKPNQTPEPTRFARGSS